MYSAAAVMFLATPFALGTYRAVPLAGLLVVALAARLLDEEKALSEELPGYDDYRRKVRWRMIPLLW
jgi:protein-S-isoprenylcysteine O-methyltransferase Ste14